MRIFYTDITRPRKLAKKLKVILNISLSESQKHIACLSGYKDWNELLIITNRKEIHSHPDKYEYPKKYLTDIFNQNEEMANQLILFFKNNLQYPNLDFQISPEIKDVIKNCNQNIIIGSNTNLPQFIYQNICEYILSNHPNNMIFKDTITKPIDINIENQYVMKIHASDLNILQNRYKQLIEEPKNSLFIYIEIQNNKIMYDFKYGYFNKSSKQLKGDLIKNMKRCLPDEIITGEKICFTFSPISDDSFNMWSQENSHTIVSKILEVENKTTNPLWLNHTKIMLNALLNALVWLRDKAGYELTAKTVWDNIDNKQMKLIINGEKYPELPQKYRNEIQYYLDVLDNIESIDSYKSHGFIQHELINVFKTFGLGKWFR